MSILNLKNLHFLDLFKTRKNMRACGFFRLRFDGHAMALLALLRADALA